MKNKRQTDKCGTFVVNCFHCRDRSGESPFHWASSRALHQRHGVRRQGHVTSRVNSRRADSPVSRCNFSAKCIEPLEGGKSQIFFSDVWLGHPPDRRIKAVNERGGVSHLILWWTAGTFHTVRLYKALLFFQKVLVVNYKSECHDSAQFRKLTIRQCLLTE